MFVKVVKCSGKEFWYKDHIGKIFEISDQNPPGEHSSRWVITPGLMDRAITTKDYKIITSLELEMQADKVREKIKLRDKHLKPIKNYPKICLSLK